MISYIKGEIIELGFNEVVVLTSGGVGYGIQIHEGIYAKLTSYDDGVELYIYHHKTENSESLFGFLEKDEKNIFIELIKISGVGGKVAMLILSMGIDTLVSAIKMKDNKTIESVKGIGKKMAEKIILELKDKEFHISVNMNSGGDVSQVLIDRNLADQIKETLVNMGYQGKDVERVFATLPEGMDDAGEILPYCIRELS